MTFQDTYTDEQAMSLFVGDAWNGSALEQICSGRTQELHSKRP